jgi:hypothetical protein
LACAFCGLLHVRRGALPRIAMLDRNISKGEHHQGNTATQLEHQMESIGKEDNSRRKFAEEDTIQWKFC